MIDSSAPVSAHFLLSGVSTGVQNYTSSSFVGKKFNISAWLFLQVRQHVECDRFPLPTLYLTVLVLQPDANTHTRHMKAETPFSLWKKNPQKTKLSSVPDPKYPAHTKLYYKRCNPCSYFWSGKQNYSQCWHSAVQLSATMCALVFGLKKKTGWPNIFCRVQNLDKSLLFRYPCLTSKAVVASTRQTLTK